MKKNVYYILLSILFSALCILVRAEKKELLIKSANNIKLKADYYKIKSKKPLILLFHQAGYSRGEYIETAKKLNKLGYSCLAIDQRSGNKINGILNESFVQANEMKLGTTYPDAYVDLEATVNYVLNNKLATEIILLGSSYSSSLIFILENKFKNYVKGIASFSPGEYFKFKNQSIAHYAAKVSCPVFITSAGNEKHYWEAIYKAIQTKKVSFLPKFKGLHGSKALWSTSIGNEKYWQHLIKFLKDIH